MSDSPDPGPNAAQDPADHSADAIADALSRLRGQRRGHPGHGGFRGFGGPRGPFAVPDRGDRHEHPHEHPRGYRGGPHAERGPGWWADAAGGRGGAPAIIRMLEALASASEPLSVSAIGEAIGVDQPRASRLVQQGVARDLVQREADPDDARRTRIALTEQGRHFTRGMRSDRRASLNTALQGFTGQERAELARLLNKLADGWPA